MRPPAAFEELSHHKYGTAIGYTLAVLATAASLLFRAALDPILGSYVLYLTIFPAVIFSAWYCGLWPSVLSIILAFLGETYWFIEPRQQFTIPHGAIAIGAFIYLIAAVFIAWMAELSRRAMAQERVLHQQLENLVEQRTSTLEKRNAELLEQTERVHKLSSRLLNLRDEERRNIARELHDSVGQLAAAMKMDLEQVRAASGALPEAARRALAESKTLLDELIASVRTLSYLLHPPLLEVLGFQAALKEFVDGFSRRSGIDVQLELPADELRPSAELELPLFRIAQECLTNVYRHSGSNSAVVRLILGDGFVELDVADKGKGIPPDKLSALESKTQVGVGIGGMSERVRQFGGTIDIESDSMGTLVRVSLPTGKESTQSRSSPREEELHSRGAAADGALP